jgi:hypothetical protein
LVGKALNRGGRGARFLDLFPFGFLQLRRRTPELTGRGELHSTFDSINQVAKEAIRAPVQRFVELSAARR